jgi:hypothetical protein
VNFPKPISIMQMLSLMFVLSMLSACGAANKGPQFTNVRPKVEPLSEEISQAMQVDSTPLLKKADLWYENSGKLLDSVTDKSKP